MAGKDDYFLLNHMLLGLMYKQVIFPFCLHAVYLFQRSASDIFRGGTHCLLIFVFFFVVECGKSYFVLNVFLAASCFTDRSSA